MRLCKMVRFVHFCAFLRFFCAFLYVFSYILMACEKAQIGAEFFKNVQQALLCSTSFSYTVVAKIITPKNIFILN